MKKLFAILSACLIGASLVACGGGGGGSSSSSSSIPSEPIIRPAHGQTAPPSDGLGVQAVTIGVQWPTGNFNFAKTCKTPNSGGVACVYLPNGGKLRAISWESSVKVPHDEILMMLVMSPGYAMDGGHTVLLSVHHNKGTDPGSNFKDVNLNSYVYIPPGYYVWVYGEGTVNSHPAGVEVQSTLFIEGSGFAAVFP